MLACSWFFNSFRLRAQQTFTKTYDVLRRTQGFTALVCGNLVGIDARLEVKTSSKSVSSLLTLRLE